MRLLLELEPESDPVWHYLNVQVSVLYVFLFTTVFLSLVLSSVWIPDTFDFNIRRFLS